MRIRSVLCHKSSHKAQSRIHCSPSFVPFQGHNLIASDGVYKVHKQHHVLVDLCCIAEAAGNYHLDFVQFYVPKDIEMLLMFATNAIF